MLGRRGPFNTLRALRSGESAAASATPKMPIFPIDKFTKQDRERFDAANA